MTLFRILAVLCLIALAALLWCVAAFPYAGFSGEVFLDIERGAPSPAIASRLEASRIIPHRWLFLVVRLLRPRASLQAGEYRFSQPATVWQVYNRLAAGDVFHLYVTVPEGSNIFDIARLLAETEIMSEDQFLAAARDPSLIRDLAPEATGLEGYLFPSTYQVTRRTTAEDLCRRMTAEFRRAWKQLDAAANVHRTVTLASLVEKETAIGAERELVASVFHNRLQAGMKLDCDPTTIYAALLEGQYRGAIYQSDLLRRHPYNTYQHPGLPPGPIANPGLASLKAALQPASTRYLFFVARPGGGGEHIFSETFQQHQAAVKRYRRAQQKSSQSQTPVQTTTANGVSPTKKPGAR
jgi:UPF0755 protein